MRIGFVTEKRGPSVEHNDVPGNMLEVERMLP